MRQLFLVTETKLHIGRGNLHKEMAEECEIDKKDILNGGVFQQNNIDGNMHIILFGESHDFGKFEVEKVQELIDANEIYWFDYINISEKCVITFDTEREETIADEF